MRLTAAPFFLPLFACLAVVPTPLTLQAQSGASPAASATAVPRQSGTIKAVTPQDFVLTNAAGQDFAVNVPATARILLVDPQTHDVKTAQPGTVADIAGGDKAVVSGTAGDSGQTMTATRVLLLKSGAIAAMHASEQAAWAHSQGGVVRSVDPAAGTLMIASGQRVTTITTTPATIVRRYTGGSVRFQDAVKSTLGAIQPGDQVQARGTRSADNGSLAAEEIVAGAFSNFSGTLTAVDAAAGTVSLKDLATKKTVTVAVTSQTNLRMLPAGFEAGGAAGSGGDARGGGQASGAPASAASAPGQGGAGSQGTAASQTGAGQGRPGARRVDLARIVNRLPTESLADLKPGAAVMIVASTNAEGERPVAITMLSGVEQLLTGPAAKETTLSPWSLGAEPSGGGEGTGGGGGGR